MTAAWTLLRREWALSAAGGSGLLLSLTFYAAITALVPLAAGPALARLTPLAAGIAWLGLALSSLLSLERLFERDLEDASLDLLVLGPLPVELVCAIKCLAQWLATGLPLALATPVAAIALGADPRTLILMSFTSLIGGLAFAFIGGLGAALSLGSRRGGLLIAVLVLPLDVPPLIFGAGAVQAFTQGLAWQSGLMLLGAYTLFALLLTPFAMAAACRNALD